jgi:hypothetical protein
MVCAGVVGIVVIVVVVIVELVVPGFMLDNPMVAIERVTIIAVTSAIIFVFTAEKKSEFVFNLSFDFQSRE